MSSNEDKEALQTIPQPRQRKRASITLTAVQKAEAVLKVWAERSTPSQVCKELNITWTILNHWQQRSMEGMLQALEPYVQIDKGTALSPRLQALLKKQSAFPQEKLMRRLNGLEKKRQTEGD